MKALTLVFLTLFGLQLMGQAPEPNSREILSKHPHLVFKEGAFLVQKELKNKGLGITHVYGVQTHQDLEIEGAVFNANIKDLRIVNLNESFVPHQNLKVSGNFVLGLSEALKAILNQIEGSSTEIPNDNWQPYSQIENTVFLEQKNLSPEKILAKKCYFPRNNQLVPAFSISYLLPNNSHWYYLTISAIDGSILQTIDWIQTCTHLHHDGQTHLKSHSNHTTTTEEASHKKANNGSYLVFKQPVASPAHGNQTVVQNPADATASPFGWHDTDGRDGAEYTITRGNNVHASEDKDLNNIPGYSPDGGSKLEFNYTYKSGGTPDEILDASITNLFYWNNILHDVWYHYGFDEESGNFQANNYEKYEIGAGDYVIADAQDGSGTNNANFATPIDGINPRMQMFLWINKNPTFEVEGNGALAGKYAAYGANFGEQLTNNAISSKLVAAYDNSSRPTLLCEDAENVSELNGNIALIERGECNFVDKVWYAQEAGAIAVVIYNDDREINTMGGSDIYGISIPSIMIDRALGLQLVAALKNESLNVKMYDNNPELVFDSGFDNGIIAHEYAHGVSNRLTGGAFNSNCLSNEEQMGEGWSDFFALVMTHEVGDKGSDLKAIGTYPKGQGTAGKGIRNYPYSTDIQLSPYNYEDIKTFSVPHGVGSVWCAMLWDMYWLFVDKYGFDPDLHKGTGGNNMAMQLVIDGLKLQKCSPGFVDGRNAILLADELRYNSANQELIWKAFAQRGLGYDASQGSSNRRDDGTQGFNMPPQFSNFIHLEKTAQHTISFGDTIHYTIKASNLSQNTYYSVQVIDSFDTKAEIITNTTNCPDWTYQDGIFTLNLDSMITNESYECEYAAIAKEGNYSKVLWQNDAESLDEPFSISGGSDNNMWQLNNTKKTKGEFSFFVPNASKPTDISLVLDLGVIPAKATLMFDHFFATEDGWDGGVIELSTNGTDWQDADNYFVINGYNGKIASNPASAISERKAFTGKSESFIFTTLNLSEFEGEPLFVKFRFASDAAQGADGWYIDNFQLLDILMIENILWGKTKEISRKSVQTIIFENAKKDSTSINFNIQEADLFPNPFQNLINVELPNNASGTWIIRDLMGRAVSSANFASNQKLQIETSAIIPGTYILEIESNNSYYRNIIIKHQD